MHIDIRSFVDPGQLARIQAVAKDAIDKPRHQPDPYYTSNNGMFAARIVAGWRADGWRAQDIRHADIQLSARALVAKLRSGMEWNAYHAESLDQAEFWRKLRTDMRSRKKDQHTVTIYRDDDLSVIMTRSGGEGIGLQLREALLSWAQDAKANDKFHKVALDLSDEDVAWFQNKLDEPAWSDAFVGYAKPTEVRIIRTAAAIKEPEAL
jgi:hypothetical protein